MERPTKPSTVRFSKYHGLGNYLVLVDNRTGQYDLTDESLVRAMCCVHTGVGAECLMEMAACRNPDHRACVYQMITHIPTGGLADFCGNGSRCMASLALRLGLISAGETFTFCGYDGVHWARHVKHGMFEVGMQNVDEVIMYDKNEFYAFTGGRTHVKFLSNVKTVDIQTEGERMAFNSPLYSEPTNVMFVEESESGEITMCPFEYGAGRETWACGTGATGAALAAERRKAFMNPYVFKTTINVRLGQIYITGKRVSDSRFENLTMTGPSRLVCDGEYFTQN